MWAQYRVIVARSSTATHPRCEIESNFRMDRSSMKSIVDARRPTRPRRRRQDPTFISRPEFLPSKLHCPPINGLGAHYVIQLRHPGCLGTPKIILKTTKNKTKIKERYYNTRAFTVLLGAFLHAAPKLNIPEKRWK